MKLTDPFDFGAVGYRIGASNQDKSRGMIVFYLRASAVMDRLDAYTAEHGGTWWTAYAPLADGKHIECQLTVQMPVGEALTAVTRCDVGEPSEGMGDPMKGAYSDALKRAAAQFGVGRYLRTELGETWVPCGAGGNGKAQLTEESHKAARQYYVNRVGGAPSPSPAVTSAPARTPAPAPSTPTPAAAGTPSPAAAGAGEHPTIAGERYPVGDEDATKRANTTMFWSEARKFAGPAVVNALCEELDLPLVKDMTLAQSKALLNELVKRAEKGGVAAPVGAAR